MMEWQIKWPKWPPHCRLVRLDEEVSEDGEGNVLPGWLRPLYDDPATSFQQKTASYTRVGDEAEKTSPLLAEIGITAS